jgi:hypothetical protein
MSAPRRHAGPNRYQMPRLDSRAGEARAFLTGAAHLGNLTPNGLRCQFNLKPATAELLLEQEREKRARG